MFSRWPHLATFLRDNKKPWFGASSDTTSFSTVPVANAPQSEAKAAVAEARKSNSQVDLKWIGTRIEEPEAIDEGCARRGSREDEYSAVFR